MANVVLSGNTSGAITIASPAVAGTNTLTLPATTGTLLTTTGDGSGLTDIAKLSTASGSAPSYSARAWVTFTGTGTVSIRASGNVSSITDNGTGDYTVNFTTAMSDADFSTLWMAQPTISNAGADTFAISPSTTDVTVRHWENNSPRDGDYCCVVVFR